jgi:DNA-binding transcriptional ArsR family regulator
MADLLPSQPDTSAVDDAEPRVIGVDSEDADDLLSALSSNTARRLLTALHEEPDTPASLADRLDTSLQNVQYHLGKLESADVVRVIDTVYSEKGREMKVYAPTDRPLVVFAGREEESTGLKTALRRLVGGFGVLAGVSLLVQYLLTDGPWFGAQTGSAGAADVQTTTESTRIAGETAATLPPGLVFFLGGTLMLSAVFGVWYVRSRA